MKLSGEDSKPIFNIEGINYIHLKRYSVYLIATTRYNSSPSLILEFLTKMACY